MKMPVRIDVVERQPRRPKGFELGGNFRADLPPHGSERNAADAQAYERVGQSPGGVDEGRNLRRWQDRIAVDQNNVKPDAQARQCARAFDGVGCRRGADHQARRAENAAPVRLFDRGVDRFAEPEIVRRNRQPIQWADSRRSRRKEKNSSPSRNRRRITSGLRTISAARVAIFGARK
jgi:hypothetical protein